jgi:hypothetical protein
VFIRARSCVTFRNMLIFSRRGTANPRPTSKTKNHPPLSLSDCLFNIFANKVDLPVLNLCFFFFSRFFRQRSLATIHNVLIFRNINISKRLKLHIFTYFQTSRFITYMCKIFKQWATLSKYKAVLMYNYIGTMVVVGLIVTV